MMRVAPELVKALVVRAHRDKDEIPALQQHPFAIDLLASARLTPR